MRGRRLDHLTNGPSSSQSPLRFLQALACRPLRSLAPPLPSRPASLGSARVPRALPRTLKTEQCNFHKQPAFPLLRSSPRLISIGQLNASQRLHLRPIYVIVYDVPYSMKDERSYLRGGFTLRCLQRLSRPYVATQLCPWQDNWCTRGMSIPVLSY